MIFIEQNQRNNAFHGWICAKQAGFSLIELSVVLFIIGLIMTTGLAALNVSQRSQASTTTVQRQEIIRDALIDYLRLNNRLPCPDTNFTAPDGIENRTTANNPATACSANFGIVPYVTLGIPREAVQDGWGNFFSYKVSNTSGANTDWTTTANFNVGNTGILQVNARAGATVSALATQVVAVIVSHGPNGFGAYTIGGTRNTMPNPTTTDESSNAHANVNLLNYYKRDPTTDDAAVGGAFDDIVFYITANDLLRPLTKDGSLQSAAAQVTSGMQKIKLSLIGYALGNPSNKGGTTCSDGAATPVCRNLPWTDTDGDGDQNTNGSGTSGNQNGTVPYSNLGLSATDTTDPWGIQYRYFVKDTVANKNLGISTITPTSATTVITIMSYGPDRVSGGGDDISLNMSAAELRGYLTNLLP